MICSVIGYNGAQLLRDSRIIRYEYRTDLCSRLFRRSAYIVSVIGFSNQTGPAERAVWSMVHAYCIKTSDARLPKVISGSNCEKQPTAPGLTGFCRLKLRRTPSRFIRRLKHGKFNQGNK